MYIIRPGFNANCQHLKYDQIVNISFQMKCEIIFSLYYWDYFGGAIAVPRRYMELVNGFPNTYFGWGGEDDDIFMR